MTLVVEIVVFAALWAAIPCLLLAVIFAALAVIDRVTCHGTLSRHPLKADRVLAQAERERVDALWADPAFTAEMERRAEQ
jgi:hypothetical protein